MSEPHPSVLIVYPDQMRFDPMGCAGDPLVGTPNLDRLASEGVRCDWATQAVFPPPDFQTHAQGREHWQRLLQHAIVEE